MKPRSIILLLSVAALAGACSKNNFAQIEPDDMYFTHNDRKATQPVYAASASTSDNYAYTDDKAPANYTSQHSPTFNSATLGSPTIQAAEETATAEFYDASVNPDEAGQSATGVNPATGVPGDYYLENYDSGNLVTAAAVPTTRNYIGNGNNAYYRNFYPSGSYFFLSFPLLGHSAISPWYDPFNPYVNPYYFGYLPYGGYGSFYPNAWWYSGLYDPYFYNYGSLSGLACNSNFYGRNPYYGSNYAYPASNGRVNRPRTSRSVSQNNHGANPSTVRYRRRNDVANNTESGGRILVDGKSSRYRRKVADTPERPGNPINTADNINRRRRPPVDKPETPSSSTIQKNKYRVGQNTNRHRDYGTRPANNRKRSNTTTYHRTFGSNTPAQKRSNSPATYNRSGSRSTYSPARSSNSYRRPSSSPSRSSYQPSRAANPSRSYRPSRAATSPSRSSGRSSGRSGRKN